MATAVQKINGQDLRALGFYPQKLTGRYGGLQVSWTSLPLPGASGAMVGVPRQIGPRRCVLTGAIIAASADLLQAKVDTLHSLLLAGTMTLESGYASRVIDVVMDGQLVIEADREFRDRALRVTVPLLAPFPFWLAKNWLPLSFGATRVQIPTGRAPSPGIITLRGGTNPVITYRSADGTVVRQLGLTWTPAANESVDIDLRPSYLTISRRTGGSGVLTSGEDIALTGGYFTIDPQDGNPDLGFYPTIEVSTGSGVLLYPLAYP